MQHAVCLTGLERSFAEIGANVREGVFGMLGKEVTFFGVRPANSTWASVHELLPMAVVEPQRGRCWSDDMQAATVAWMHCDFRLRAGDCRLSFLQALCDLSHCEDLISDYERTQRGGKPFDAVMRLRADLFWEASVALPAPLRPNTVYTPAMDCQNGLNDHLGVGERGAMRKYLTRIRHANRSDAVRRLKGLGSEGYMHASLRWDGIESVRLQEWMYCPHTPRNLLRDSARTGCIGRVRCRTACTSLWCPSVSIKAGECECLNETCAAFSSGRGAGRHGATAVVGTGGGSHVPRAGYGPTDLNFQFRHWRKPPNAKAQRDWLRWCVDLGPRQLFHACPARGGTATTSASRALPSAAEAALATCGGEVCPWKGISGGGGGGGGGGSSLLPELPACVFPSRGLDPRLTTIVNRTCSPRGVQRGHFTGTNGHWLW
jgi:hypothetical protein